jgi:hypothetical protein
MRTMTLAAMAAVMFSAVAQAAPMKPERVQVTGEIIDSWCYLTDIMYPEGSAHHLCALWCAAGGIPVGIKGDDGKVYTVLKMGADSTSVANPGILEIQSHRVKVEADLYVRDGINYLTIAQVISDEGIVNLTHDEYGIQPFGE